MMDLSQIRFCMQELLVAHLGADEAEEERLLEQLLAGDRRDVLQVTTAVLAPLTRHMSKHPGEDFYRPTVSVQQCDGTVRPGSLTELPPARRTAIQMLVALANQDTAMVTDLWVGYVGDHGCRARLLITTALGMASQHLIDGLTERS